MLSDDFVKELLDIAPNMQKSIGRLESVVYELDENVGGYKDAFDLVLEFLLKEYDCDLKYLIKSYLFLNKTIMEENYYFVKNGYSYRYKCFEEVNRAVYGNASFMKRYMCGLELSSFLWTNHYRVLNFFEKNKEYLKGPRYLEIGVGFGIYLDRVSEYAEIQEYVACDVSPTSLEKCRNFIDFRNKKLNIKYVCGDIMQESFDTKFSSIVMGEVLEHVERPSELLGKCYTLLEDNGCLYITTAINAPTVDHIFLFENEEAVFKMIQESGFEVINYICAPANDINMLRAKKKKMAISLAAFLKKRKG